MSILHSPFSILHSRRTGQAVLSLVFLVGGIVTVVSVTLAFIVLSFINSSSGFEKSNRAIAVASAGVSDALVLLTRNKDFAEDTPYTVPVGSFSASVTVTQDSPIVGEATILSRAIVSFYERRIEAVVSIASSTGEIQLLSWRETTL